MRTKTPRLPGLTNEQLTPEQEEYFAPLRDRGIDSHVLRSLLRHLRASKAFRTWSAYSMGGGNKLADREREVVAMRTAWLIKAGYVWSRHIPYGTNAGLTAEEMEALKKPISAHPWSDADIALIHLAEDQVANFFISDKVWAELNAHFDEEQIIDAIFVCGHFMMLGMFLNSAGLPIDDDVVADPDLEKL
ncbi:carboxymuconolactone decarboxylase family protein [Sphingobium nicotianae]|uniref:Carboxymuconolactone decarboxylase family protein n=1 Tax=Sphingobium nicotianae TaxID=2782607 RepID=A0A9X1DC45_9SPHN|nr:carboxymuconolactone decarboxylase family protein [Sphingobium nicotianae]MBT2187375.1 carboxymuconolactone decarboxylase family protein [Sphingobium nicotianae]